MEHGTKPALLVILPTQGAWTQLSERHVNADGHEGSVILAQEPAPNQKRARPSEDAQPDVHAHGRVAVQTESSKSPDAQAPTAEVSSANPGSGRRAKGGRAKRRKAAAAAVASSEEVQGFQTATPSISDALKPTLPASTETSVGAKALLDAAVLGSLEAELVSLKALAVRSKGLFEWVDGPLVTAMRNGELILLDELSLAEDAVLERLNSVLEPGRSITLAEKGGEGASGGQGAAQTVVAAQGFR